MKPWAVSRSPMSKYQGVALARWDERSHVCSGSDQVRSSGRRRSCHDSPRIKRPGTIRHSRLDEHERLFRLAVQSERPLFLLPVHERRRARVRDLASGWVRTDRCPENSIRRRSRIGFPGGQPTDRNHKSGRNGSCLRSIRARSKLSIAAHSGNQLFARRGGTCVG